MAWKRLVKHTQWIKPNTFEEVCATSLWFNPDLDTQLQASFSRERISEFHKLGLRRIHDTWNLAQGKCHSWLEATARFPHLRNEEEACWEIIGRTVSSAYDLILARGPFPPMTTGWLGLYIAERDILPALIAEGPGTCNIACD